MNTSRDSDDRDDGARQVVEVLLGSWRARCLYAGVRLGVPAALAAGPSSIEDLALRVGADPGALMRLLRVWVDAGIVRHCSTTGSYRIAPAFSDLHGASTGSGPLADLVLLYEGEFRQAWEHLEDWVRDPATTGFERAFGHDIHTRIARDSEFRTAFSGGMGALDTVFSQLAEVCVTAMGPMRWTFADIGGGRGALAGHLVRRSAGQATGVVFDLGHVVAERAELDGIEPVAGDMFDQVPPGFDCYFLSRILQDWGDARCVEILSNIRQAATPGSRLWVLERSVGPEQDLANLWDVHLGCVAGGTERTAEEYGRLFEQCGWTVARVWPLSLQTDLYELAVS